MILLVLLAVVLVASAGAGLVGLGVLSSARRDQRTGLLAAVSAPVVLVLGVAVLGVVVLGVGGIDGPGPGQEGIDGPGPGQESIAGPGPAGPGQEGSGGPERPAPATQSLPSARLDSPAARLPVVRIQAVQDDSFAAYEPVSGLVPGAAVRVLADGFGWVEDGRVEQCVLELDHLTACGEAFPVRFDDGRADFQVAVHDDISPGRCRAGQATCLLRLTAADGRTGAVQTVLVDPFTPGLVRITPAQGVSDGQAVEVTVTGFPPGATAAAVLCAPPAAYDARRCAPADPAATFVTDSAGAGRTTLVVSAGRLGPDGAVCGPRRPCGVAVVAGDGFVAAPVAPVTFSAGPGPAYDAGRLIPGIVVAVALSGLAVAIARRTDWSRPEEAATPELDAADLRAGQDLDELFGSEAELDERDPIPW